MTKTARMLGTGGKTKPKMQSKMQSKMMPGMKPGGATNDKLEMVAKGDKMVPKFAVDGKGPNDLGKIKTMKKMYTGGKTMSYGGMTSKTEPKGGGPKG
tara:strand:+ start:284 stop:577 length:294 start_codon:yes stop_codon:yes gene_type:complete